MSSSAHRSSDPYDRVWQRIRYGRRYSELFELARDITSLRPMFHDAEQAGHDCDLNPSGTSLLSKTAMSLLKAAVTSSKKLREVAAALDAEMRKDPFQVNLLRAYRDCTDNPEEPPTLADVRKAFINRFSRDWGRTLDDRRGKTDFSVRKTLRMLGLPLANARRGRPPDSRSQIGNPRRGEE
jgi:hypothetical protein